MEADAEGGLRQQIGVCLGLQTHQHGFGISSLQLVLQRGDPRRGVLREELRAQIDQRSVVGLHVLVGGDQVARLQVVGTQTEDRNADLGRLVHRHDAGVANAVGVLARLVQRLSHERGQGGDVTALQHRDCLLAFEGGGHFGFGERLQQLDGDDADLLALAAQIGRDRLGVVGDRAQPDHHRLGVLAHEGLDRSVFASRQCGVFFHHLARELRYRVHKVRAVVGGAGLEIGLVLHRTGEAGIVHVDQSRNALTGSLFIRVKPLPAPLGAEFFGNPCNGLFDELAFVVLLDRIGVFIEEGRELLRIAEIVRVARDILLQLEHAALGAEQHLLRHRGAFDAARRIAEEFLEQCRFGHQGLAQHVAGDEAVHGVGDRDQRQGAELVGDRGKIGGFLRIAAEQDRVTGLQQGIDVVMAGHHVERMLGDDAGRDLQHKTADPLADGDVMRFQPVQDALAGRSVGNVLAAGERRAERARLRRMFAFGFEEKWMVAPDVAAAAGTERLIYL